MPLSSDIVLKRKFFFRFKRGIPNLCLRCILKKDVKNQIFYNVKSWE